VQLLAFVHLRSDVDAQRRHRKEDHSQEGGHDGDGTALTALTGFRQGEVHSILISVIFDSVMSSENVLPTGVIHECL
jgi:hypothetical protein